MNVEELDAAAKVAAATVPDWFDDVRQEAWVRFLRYKPRTITGAWAMAFSARNDLLSKEGAQRRLPKRILKCEGHPRTPRLATKRQRFRLWRRRYQEMQPISNEVRRALVWRLWRESESMTAVVNATGLSRSCITKIVRPGRRRQADGKFITT